MTTKPKCDARYHPSTIAAVLRMFIASGSANGDEPMREWLLDRAEMFAAAPALLEACRAGENFTRRFAAIQQAIGVNTAPVESALGKLRAAIVLATEGGDGYAAATQ